MNTIEEEQPNWSPRLIRIRQLAEGLGKGLKPYDDWVPSLFVDGICPAGMPGMPPEAVGKPTMVVVGAFNAMDNDSTKDSFSDFIVMLGILYEAIGMTLLSTVWLSELKEVRPIEGESEEDERRRIHEAAENAPRPRNDPDRKEALMLMSIYVGGEDDGMKLVMADVKRGGPHPVLQNWQIKEPGDCMGRFPKAIHAGLKMAQIIRAARKKGAGE